MIEINKIKNSFFFNKFFKLFVWSVAIFTLLLYAQSINFGYNFDDELVTKGHPKTSQGLKAIGKIFSSPYYEDESGYAYEYRPVALAFFAIEHSLFGENPFTSHFINVLLYAITCSLIFVLLKLLLVDYHPYFPILITLLFSVFPLHTEVVASIKNRDEILALMFGVSTAIVLLKENKKFLHYILAILLFTLSILSKQSALVFLVM